MLFILTECWPCYAGIGEWCWHLIQGRRIDLCKIASIFYTGLQRVAHVIPHKIHGRGHDASFWLHGLVYPPELRGFRFLLCFTFVAMGSWSGFACHCKLLELVWSVLSITENCFSSPKFICLIARCFPIISINIIAPLIVPVCDARTSF